jgi:hypothetical protein
VAPFVTKRRFDFASNAAISDPALPEPLFARPRNSSEIPVAAETGPVPHREGTIETTELSPTDRPKATTGRSFLCKRIAPN